MIGPPGAIPGLVTRPARLFEPISLFAVGLGETRPVTSPGQVRVEAANLTRQLYVFSPTIGLSEILYTGIAPAMRASIKSMQGVTESGKNLLKSIFPANRPAGPLRST